MSVQTPDGKKPDAGGDRARPQLRGEEEPASSAPAGLPSATGDPGADELFPVVAIGASAGGLAALKSFFSHVPKDSGVAFVVVVHLSPEHKSHLDELLQPHVPMPVEQVTHTIAIQKNHVYLIPPNANLDTIDTHLRLTNLEKHRQERTPIDHFFRTLAETHNGHAIGVILTGTGSDGTLGLRQIKERGGLTVVQDPAEAEYDGMPRSAIASAPVDLILPLAKIPQAILRFAHTEPRVMVPDDGDVADTDTRQLLHKVFVQLRARTGRDFSHYKRSTLLRRISRRMQFNHIQEPSAYVEYLRKHPDEARALADDLLITVTSFFRDAEVFETLEKDVIPQLFEGKGPGDTVRVWSVGCATGEEAYSLAMLLMEEATRREAPPAIQIFASDLHQQSLAKAREGIYSGDIETDVGSHRLGRFFQSENGGYRVRKEVRELVIFAPHNVLADPPFSRLDLIACRNLLIYLQRDLQQKVAELFHYALLQNGFLVLGLSEAIDAPELFRLDNKKRCVYRKRNVPAPDPRLPVFPLTRGRISEGLLHAEHAYEPAAYGALHQRMVEQYGPPSILVTPDDSVVHFSEHAGRYLVHPGGAPTANVYKLVREELRIEMRAIMHAARRHRKIVRSKPIPVRFNGESSPVVLDVRPALEPEKEGFLLLMFDEQPAPEAMQPDEADEAGGLSLARVHEMEAEKQVAEQRLQAIIEEYETSQEEIRASNEELQSTNEELRSTLEELETSKEELQSMNEELQTVNQENRHKVDELGQLSSDLQNLFAATDIATIFLDRDLRILRVTPKVAELFNVRVTDRGRSLSDFTNRLGYDELKDDAKKVLDRLVPIEREVRDGSGRWYLSRILPYRNADDRIVGVVVTFVEITQRKQSEDEVRQAKEYAEHIIETLPEPLLVLASDLTIISANAAFYEHFKVKPEETRGCTIYDIGNGQWDIPSLRMLLEDVLPDNNHFKGYQIDHEFENLGRRVLVLNGQRLDHMQLILLGIRDITEQFDAEAALRESEARYRALAELSPEAILVNAGGQYVYANKAAARLLAAEVPEQLVGRSPFEFLEPEYHDVVRERLRKVVEEQHTAERMVYHWKRLDGVPVDVEVIAGPIDWQNKPAVQVLGRDVTERKRAEDQLHEANRHKDEYLAMLGHELRNPLAAMRNATELIKLAGTDDPRVHRAHGVLERQSSHMARIINELLDVSRIAQGKVHLELELLDVRKVVETVLEDSTAQVSARGLELTRDIAAEPLWIAGDEIRLAQIIDNLVSNAIKFTNAPGSITVAVERDEGWAVIRIRDTGVGIHTEMLSRIFEAFRQETQDTARTTGGLGLGLSLAKGLVELHQGSICARSAGPGTGAEFEVRLPLSSAPDEGAKKEPANAAPPSRILIVEDNGDTAQMLCDLLELTGHDVTVVASGWQALESLHSHGADIVLCDLGLPGMSGHELARAIRADAVLRDIPLVALTGYGQPADREQTKQAGFDAHLVKPVDLHDLNLVLNRLSRGRT